jgi:ribosomal protein S19E (S16A)
LELKEMGLLMFDDNGMSLTDDGFLLMDKIIDEITP